MKLLKIERSPADSAGYTRLSGSYARERGGDFTVDFVFPAAYEDWLSEGTEAWCLLGLASAFCVGEDYWHPHPVDAELVRNTRALVKQWRAFFPGKREITLHVQPEDRVAPTGPRKRVCFFTGGVDSSLTLTKNIAQIDVLMQASFNFDRTDRYAYVATAQENFANSTRVFGKDSFVVATNILWPFEEFADAWSFLTHGPALASMAHLFSKEVGSVLISSSAGFGDLAPWGSHPLTDPLLSSSALSVVHYGATYSRFEKVAALAGAPDVVSRIEVCGMLPEQKRGLVNCSRCQKCLRTMLALDICGVTPSQATSFDWTDYRPKDLRKMRLHHPNEYIYFEELIRAAQEVGRSDIVEAARASIARSRKFKPLVKIENVLRQRFSSLARVKALKTLKRRFYRVAS